MTTYHIVKGEGVLVHSTERADVYQVMARRVTSHHNNFDLLVRHPDELLPATQEDFNIFRVCSKGHIT